MTFRTGLSVILVGILSSVAGAEDDLSGHFALGEADISQCVILTPADPGSVVEFAAKELQKHLYLITGHELEVTSSPTTQKAFCVGLFPPGPRTPLRSEESRYLIRSDRVYLYGEDHLTYKEHDPFLDVVSSQSLKFNRVGTLFAVYMFLEKELSVRWLEPGDDGIVYPNLRSIELAPAEATWRSLFDFQRGFRTYGWQPDRLSSQSEVVPAALRLTDTQIQSRRYEDNLWLRRMRMGNRGEYLAFSHAFTQWWGKYGRTHPEYFALNGRGEKKPLFADRPDRVKMCVTNPSLHKQIVREWLERKDSPYSYALDVSENDGGGGGLDEFCHCPRCRAVDVVRPGESFGSNLTDRYVYFYNACLAEARKHDPSAIVCGYAYSNYLQPPRKQTLADGVVIEFVSKMGDEFGDTDSFFRSWRDHGMRRMLFRPNDLCAEIGLPMGHEKRLFDHQQIAVKYGALGTDHDSLHGFWTGTSGLSYYILAKSHVDPTKPFSHWEDEYASAFGAAREDVKAFFRYWRRQVFEQRLMPAHRRDIASGGRGLLGWSQIRRYVQAIDDYYRLEDFDRTDAILKKAAERSLTDLQQKLIRRLSLANQHNRLTFRTMSAIASGDTIASLRSARELTAFRIRHRYSLRMSWPRLFIHQNSYGNTNTFELAEVYDQLAKETGQLDLSRGKNILSNGGFEEDLEGWNVSLWNPDTGGKAYKGLDVQVSDNGSISGSKHLRVKIHAAESDGVYGLSRTVTVSCGSVYILQYAWKRAHPKENSSSFQTPRLRVTFRTNEGKSTLYKGRTALWYETSNTTPQTDWIVERRILRIEPDSDIRRLNITFHFATSGQDCLDDIQLLEF